MKNMASSYNREKIIDKLLQMNCFWSYAAPDASSVSDEQIIEKVLVYLDLEDIDSIVAHYGKAVVKHVWLTKLVPQSDYYHTLNRFLAWYYFDIKRPDTYLKQQTTRQLNKLLK